MVLQVSKADQEALVQNLNKNPPNRQNNQKSLNLLVGLKQRVLLIDAINVQNQYLVEHNTVHIVMQDNNCL
jgi:hypothetical protein